MDFNKIKLIKEYKDKILKFRKLDKFKKLNNKDFGNEMKKIFSQFHSENIAVFDMIIENKNLNFLDLMFNKLDKIEEEYNKRKHEIENISPFVDKIKLFLNNNTKVSKDGLISYCRNNLDGFYNRYPVIVTRLADEDCRNLTSEELFFDEIKHKYEVEIGEILANKYITNKI